MLLGVGLHAALAYIGIGWIVNDPQSSTVLGSFISSVHGFRMPLFFLLSGFFTAMLWRKRGIGGLLKHRFIRIVLPFLIAFSTITPTMLTVISWSGSRQAQLTQVNHEAQEAENAPAERAPSSDIWTVASYGDMEGLSAYTSDSDQLDAHDPMFGVTPLGWAAVKDHPNAAKYLLEVGADPNARYRDQNTPLHTASFFGRAEIAEYLLDAGADISLRNGTDELITDSMAHNQQVTEYIANMLQLPIDFEEVSAGREQIQEMIAVRELEVVESSANDTVTKSGSFASTIKQLQSMHLFHHLWFLWFLCWLIAGFATVTCVLSFLPKLKLPGMLFSVPVCFFWIVPLTLLVQSQMHSGGTVPGFGPDTSTGLIPVPHVLLYYAIFFGFGALMFSYRGAEKKLGPFWYITLPLGLIALPFGLMFAFDAQKSAEMIADDSTRSLVSNLLQVLYAWLMTFGLLGLFEAVLKEEKRWIRYISDSSYWIYLIHLPLIIAGQVLLLSVDMHPYVKFTLLVSIGSVILFLSYALFVRYTPIGHLLNGKRTKNSPQTS